MKTTYKITIPEPCHEDWAKMTAVEKGRHCAVCEKNVIDFTQMSNTEIARNLDKGEKLCGRFASKQLDTELTFEESSNKATSYAAAAVFGALSLTSVNAQNSTTPNSSTPATQHIVFGKFAVTQQQTTPAPTIQGNIIVNEEVKCSDKGSFTISGTVKDFEYGLPGTAVFNKTTNTGVMTDFNGYYQIVVTEGDILEFSYLGFESKTVTIKTKDQTVYDVLLVEDDLELLGEIVVLERKTS